MDKKRTCPHRAECLRIMNGYPENHIEKIRIKQVLEVCVWANCLKNPANSHRLKMRNERGKTT